jgi:ClpX C4-type zinc finger protein
MFGRHGRDHNDGEVGKDLLCSFCNKSEHHVRKLVAGPTAHICDECVAVFVEIMADDPQSSEGKSRYRLVPQPTATQEPWPARNASCTFCGRLAPSDMALVIENRAVLCESCVSVIAAAAAAHRGTTEEKQ